MAPKGETPIKRMIRRQQLRQMVPLADSTISGGQSELRSMTAEAVGRKFLQALELALAMQVGPVHREEVVRTRSSSRALARSNTHSDRFAPEPAGRAGSAFESFGTSNATSNFEALW